MKEISKFVLKHDILLLSDEVYSELVYDGKPASFASFPELKDNLILLNGFSKSWAMTGFRLGYACGPASLIGTMMKIHQYGIMSAPTLSQSAGVEAMDNGDRDVARMRAEYRRRRDFLVDALNRMGLKTILPKGAFYVFADISRTGLKDEEFCLRLLDEHDVACVPGSAFGACGEGFVRMSYATSLEKIRVATERLTAFLRSLQAR
jgi:aminotransferase